MSSADSEYHEAEYLDITVTDPTKVNDGSGEFTRYKITTEVCCSCAFFLSLPVIFWLSLLHTSLMCMHVRGD